MWMRAALWRATSGRSNAHLLTLSSFQLFYGKLHSLFSIKIVYMVAIALFEVGSLICTTAPNSTASKVWWLAELSQDWELLVFS